MNKTFLLISLCLISFLLSKGQSENKITIVSPDKPRIEVIGTAEQLVEPDLVFLSITLKEKFKDGEKLSVESQEEMLKSELTKIGLNLDRLTLTDANTETIRISKKSKKVISTKSYNLKLSNVVDVRKTFEIIDKLDITDANITKTDISNRIEILKSVRIEAIKAAKKKAEYLLEAIGHQIDTPILIREIQERNFDYSSMNSNISSNVSNVRLNQLTVSESEIEDLTIQKISITAKVYVEFAIK